MIRILVGLLLLAGAAHAQIPVPACYPNEPGCTRAYLGLLDGGYCLQWYTPAPAGFCGELASLPTALEAVQTASDAWWTAEVTRSQSELTAAEQSAWQALLANQPVYTVASLTGSTSRPTYPVVDGARSTRSNGRVAIGTTCDCSLQIGNYCSVASQPDAVKSTPLPDNTVAICAQ